VNIVSNPVMKEFTIYSTFFHKSQTKTLEFALFPVLTAALDLLSSFSFPHNLPNSVRALLPAFDFCIAPEALASFTEDNGLTTRALLGGKKTNGF